MNKPYFFLWTLMLLPAILFAQTRVVCVGNSVTAGYGLADANTQAWPARLGALLGSKYVVYNCGVSGTTMLKNGSSPYWNTTRFNDAKNYNPDILIISLGTNDSHPNNWIYKNNFYADYASMIDAFRQNGRNPQIYVVYPVACYGDAAQISNLQNELIPLVNQISRNKGASIIDFNTPTQNQRNTLYNDNLHPNAAGASLLGLTAFNTITPTVPAFYGTCNYVGSAIKLGIGDYTLSALTARGINDNDISSIKVPVGYKVFGYVNDNFTGNYVTLTADNSCLGGWDNLITSIRVRANGVTGKNGTYTLQNRNSGKYMDVAGGSAADGADILQWTGNNQTNQQFTFTDQGDGAYRISNVATGKSVDVAGATTNNAGNVLQWTASAGINQRFILLTTDNTYYKFKAAHSGRVVEVYGGGLNNNDDVVQYDDNNQTHAQWRLLPVAALRTAAITSTPDTTDNNNLLESEQTAISAFPNPVNDKVTVTNIKPNTAITVYDLNGQIKLRSNSGSQKGQVTLNIGHLKAGPYFIKVGDTRTVTLKILKR